LASERGIVSNKFRNIGLALGLGVLVLPGAINFALQSSYAEAGLKDSYSTPAASAEVPVPEEPRVALPTNEPVQIVAPLAVSPNPMPSFDETPRPIPTPTFPAGIPIRVIERLMELPRIQELTDVSNIVTINGEYCVAGELKVICYNETEDTFNVWDDFDTNAYFYHREVSPSPAP
jgi:hypothetical protein